MAVHAVAGMHSLPRPTEAAGLAEATPLPPWFPGGEAARPVYDLQTGSYVHKARANRRATPRERGDPAGAAGGVARLGASHEENPHHGVAARAKVRPTFPRAVRRPVDELARQPAALPRRGKLPQPSTQARQIAALSQQAAFEARLEPLVPTSDDLIPRCGDRGPRVLNPPWSGALHGDAWAAALCSGRASVPRGDGGAFART
eukprot:COSAG02_NODE_80_length_40128_cov_591.169002_7_plen_203_part_00